MISVTKVVQRYEKKTLSGKEVYTSKMNITVTQSLLDAPSLHSWIMENVRAAVYNQHSMQYKWNNIDEVHLLSLTDLYGAVDKKFQTITTPIPHKGTQLQ